jgi:endonuclease III-like uncharacterized protein
VLSDEEYDLKEWAKIWKVLDVVTAHQIDLDRRFVNICQSKDVEQAKQLTLDIVNISGVGREALDAIFK